MGHIFFTMSEIKGRRAVIGQPPERKPMKTRAENKIVRSRDKHVKLEIDHCSNSINLKNETPKKNRKNKQLF